MTNTTKMNSHSFKLFDWQEEALGHLRSGAILKGDVGSGKTITSLEFYRRNFSHLDLYVITTAMKRDTNDWDHEAAIVGVELTKVDSWNNIKKYKDVKNAFFIFDEQGASGYGMWAKSFIAISRSNKWILLSATPGDVWINYMPAFIANGFYRNKTDFIKKHVVYNPYTKFPSIQKYTDVGILIKLRQRIEVIMKNPNKHTERVRKYVDVLHDEDQYRYVTENLWDIYKNEPIQNTGQYASVVRNIVNSSQDRIWQAEWIISNHDRIIVYYNFNFELEILKDICQRLERTMYQRNGHRHDPVPEGQEWVYLVQYASGNEGWNCITTNAMMFYSLNYSYRVHEQCEGRIDRVTTKYDTLEYFYLVSQSKIDKDIRKALIKKEKFNEGSWGESLWRKNQLL